MGMDSIARDYVRLVLAVGQHDPHYVDAFYGPPELKAEVDAHAWSLSKIREKAMVARGSIGAPESNEMLRLRQEFLAKQLDALIARVDLLNGVKMTFDEESAALYDVVDAGHDDAYYADAVAQLEPLLPGDGLLSDRFEAFRKRFTIPPDRLPDVFKAAIEAARAETKRYIPLAEGENFEIEYVKGQVWGAYNWYKGNSHSLIQVNTDLPSTIDSALGLAAHEGYPGHHVYNALLEQKLAVEQGWVEFTVYPLYSPESLIAEGTAEYGVELCFPPDEKLAFEKQVLYPLAGLDPGQAEEYAAVIALVSRFGYASNDAGRRYLDGKATRDETVEWLVKYALSSPERADRRLRFIEHNRSYVVTYNLGKDLVKKYVEAKATTREEKWAVFAHLLSTPQVPSALR